MRSISEVEFGVGGVEERRSGRREERRKVDGEKDREEKRKSVKIASSDFKAGQDSSGDRPLFASQHRLYLPEQRCE